MIVNPISGILNLSLLQEIGAGEILSLKYISSLTLEFLLNRYELKEVQWHYTTDVKVTSNQLSKNECTPKRFN